MMLFEALFAVAILAILLLALAVAINSFTKAAGVSQDYADAMNLARGTMTRMTNVIRSSDGCAIQDIIPGADPNSVTGTSLVFVPDEHGADNDERPHAYRFQKLDNQPQLIYYQDAAAPHSSNADIRAHGKSMGKIKSKGKSGRGGSEAEQLGDVVFTAEIDPVEGSVLSVQIKMTVISGGASVTLCDSAIPRRNMKVR